MLARRGAAVLYIGDRSGPEAELAPRQGVDFIGVTVGNPRRSRAVGAAWAALRGAGEARRHIVERVVDVVISTGGYASAPVVLAAATRRIPIVLHEPNAVAGRANRWLARFSTRVAVGFEQTARCFQGGKSVVTGAAIRTPCGSPDRAGARRRFGLPEDASTLLVVGGSQGSVAMNAVVLEALDGIAALGYAVLHQTGARHFEGRPHEEMARRTGYCAVPYIEDMPAAYAAADVILCRAGASTLAETAYYGVPPVFVPLTLAGGHQRENAAIFARAGAARSIEQAELTPQSLCRALMDLADDAARRAMRDALAAFSRPDAADQIARIAMGLAKPRMGEE